MTVKGVLLGVVLTHVFWAAIFVGWWYFLIRRSGPDVRQQVEADFKAVRDSFKRAQQSGRN